MRTLRAIWGTRIREARLNSGLTQAQFAVAVGADQANVSRWERGLAVPRDDRRSRIAEVLGVDPDALFSYDTNGDNQAVA